MTFSENPFTPSFGEIPAHLAGRKPIIDDLTRALQSEQRRPELTTVFSGARGTGKTTLLSLVANKAIGMGWIVASTTALPGMLEDIELRVKRGAAHLFDEQPGLHVSSVNISNFIGFEIAQNDPAKGNWRLRIDSLLDQLEKTNTGLLITVDEVDVNLDEMVQLAAVYQHFVREGRKVALLMAGLPHNISSLLNDKTVSFLRRAQIEHLGKIEDYEIEDALEKSIRDGGRAIQPTDLHRAVQAIDGFPFMMQLVGYRAWDATPDAKNISSEDIDRGITRARQDIRSRILDATYRELSAGDIEFARAMLNDEGDSRIADIQARLGKSSSQVAQYRKRLIDAGVIGERSRGIVGFDLPFFREFLIERTSDTSD